MPLFTSDSDVVLFGAYLWSPLLSPVVIYSHSNLKADEKRILRAVLNSILHSGAGTTYFIYRESAPKSNFAAPQHWLQTEGLYYNAKKAGFF
jgi:hypothetical protein